MWLKIAGLVLCLYLLRPLWRGVSEADSASWFLVRIIASAVLAVVAVRITQELLDGHHSQKAAATHVAAKPRTKPGPTKTPLPAETAVPAVPLTKAPKKQMQTHANKPKKAVSHRAKNRHKAQAKRRKRRTQRHKPKQHARPNTYHSTRSPVRAVVRAPAPTRAPAPVVIRRPVPAKTPIPIIRFNSGGSPRPKRSKRVIIG
jgi:hypothetical protein